MDIDWVTALLYILISLCCVIPVAITIGGMIFSLLSDLVILRFEPTQR
jgi:hypothetical protein